VQQAKGDVVLFLNNDVEVISPFWINEMVSHAVREDIGAVGAMLYYPNNTIQHAGVILGLGGIAGHLHCFEPRGFTGQRGKINHVQNFSAVTGACLAIEKKKFLEVGGFDEFNFPISYNDVDLCLRLISAGYRNLWTPDAELYHLESATRGSGNNQQNDQQFMMESEYMRKTWGNYLSNDPCYNPNLSLISPVFSLAFPPRMTKPWEK